MSTAAANARVTSPPPLGPESPVLWPERTVRSLPNGLQVVLAEARRFPKINAHLSFRTGNAALAQRTPGLADLTATVVRTGTASRTSRQIEEDLRRMGGDLGSTAGADTCAISTSGLSEFSDGLLELLADLARNASFPEEDFARERRHKIESLRVERTNPSFLAAERFRRVLFGEHPYAFIAPTEQQVAGYGRKQLEEFYHHYYTPSNALLVLVGDFSASEMLERVEKIFGDWQEHEAHLAVTPAPPRFFGRHIHLVHLTGTVQTQILAGNMAITRQNSDWHGLAMANSIYGGAFHSRLVMNIREQKGYTYSPRSSITAFRQHGFFSVSAAVRNDVVAASIAEIFYEMDRMRALPVSPEELESARNYMSGVFSLGLATQDGLLGQISSLYLDRLPDDYLETYRQKIRALTAENVLDAARRYMDSANSQIVVVGDRDQIAHQAALFGPVETYEAQDNKP
jgi:zinc protease